MANKKDLANGLVGTALTSADTTLVLQAGYGDSMPAVPFFLTITPAGQLSTRGNSEIVNVTARTGDTLTIERAQKDTTARAFSVGDVVSNSIYANEKMTPEDIDWTTLGGVSMSSTTSTSTNLTVTTKSIINAYGVTRHASGTSGSFGVVVTTSNGTIYNQVTTRTSQDQTMRHMSATCYALVGPGTYTISHDVSGGSRDNPSTVAMAMPALPS